MALRNVINRYGIWIVVAALLVAAAAAAAAWYAIGMPGLSR